MSRSQKEDVNETKGKTQLSKKTQQRSRAERKKETTQLEKKTTKTKQEKIPVKGHAGKIK
jgi:hypothetical protein